MDIAIFGFHRSVQEVVADALRADTEGFSGFFMHNGLQLDACTTLVRASTQATGIDLGAAVVPIQTRHPFVMAQEALTANEAMDGRFVLGIGLSHPFLVEGQWGVPFDRPVSLMAEYLDVLVALLDHREVDHTGERLQVRTRLRLTGARPRLLMAALGPRMLALAGSRTDGTITWMVGPKTLRATTVPVLTAAAEAAGRPRPEILAGVPVCVTKDVSGARDRVLATELDRYATMPAYMSTLRSEGVASPADLCLIGSADEVAHGLHSYVRAGATTILARACGSAAEREDTRQALVGIARGA